MPEEVGPFLTFGLAWASAFPAFVAAMIWSQGHLYALALKGREIPAWLIRSMYNSQERFDKVVEGIRPYQVYVKKGLAWTINLSWACLWLLIWPGEGVEPYEPVIDNLVLIHIGLVVAELVWFLVLTGIFRWLTRAGRKQG